jgi:hypothetical protein
MQVRLNDPTCPPSEPRSMGVSALLVAMAGLVSVALDRGRVGWHRRLSWALLGGSGLVAVVSCYWRRGPDRALRQRIENGGEEVSAEYHQETLRQLVGRDAGHVDLLVGRIFRLRQEEALRVQAARQLRLEGASRAFDQQLREGVLRRPLYGSVQLESIEKALRLPCPDFCPSETQRREALQLETLAIQTRLARVQGQPYLDQRFAVLEQQVTEFREALSQNIDVARLRLIEDGIILCGTQEWAADRELVRLTTLGFQLALRIGMQERRSAWNMLDNLQLVVSEHVSGQGRYVHVALCRARLRLDPAAATAPQTDEGWRQAANEEVRQLAQWLLEEPASRPQLMAICELQHLAGLPLVAQRPIGRLVRCLPQLPGLPRDLFFVDTREYLATLLGGDGGVPATEGPWDDSEVSNCLQRFPSPLHCMASGLLDRASILEQCSGLAAMHPREVISAR